MPFTGITTKGPCVNLDCDKPRHAKGLCRRHYEQLMYPNWAAKRNPLRRRTKRVSEPTPKELNYTPIDYDDFWLWVKKELGL